MELIGDVKGKNVILVDDMIDTGTLAKAADLMMEKEL
jgi:ribose-phosphate pyrophosphokinase